LTDGRGRTLYTFSNDSLGNNTFTKSDFSNNSIWPIYENDDQFFRVPSTLDRSLFWTISIFGRTQLTYNGWPLYYYGSDNSHGNTKGVSVPTPGIWPVAVKDLPVPPGNYDY
jgi:predicted lipoprotein with Yx(FWY)xxD motif